MARRGAIASSRAQTRSPLPQTPTGRKRPTPTPRDNMPSTFAKAEIYKALASISASQRVLDVLTELHGEALDEPPFVSTDIPDDASPAAVQDARQARTRGLYVALDPEKCALAYLLLRASGARTVVEAGTGFGLSTIYLALAVGQNAAAAGVARPGPAARVIATELEPAKAARARENWDRAGVEDVSRWIELRKGDLRHTLKENMPSQVDCLLLDIWTPLALPTLRLVKPYLKKGAIVLADNFEAAKEGYRELLEYVSRPNSGFKGTILPYAGGLQMLVYVGSD
ncbi:hypothetical protein RB598_002217 [Gaeumannomyces tritici]